MKSSPNTPPAKPPSPPKSTHIHDVRYSPFSPTMLLVRATALFVWSITYLCYLLLALFFAQRLHLTNLAWPAPWSALYHPLLATYAAAEVAFHIYLLRLARSVQRRGKPPMYGRRFLRSVFARALEYGMDHLDEGGNRLHETPGSVASPWSVEETNLSDLRRRKRQLPGVLMTPLDGAKQDSVGVGATVDKDGVTGVSPLATTRLRSGSLLPSFVVQKPLHRDDPRAQEFRDAQAKWFPGAHWSEITARDVEHWLAWALYSADLEELERERAEAEKQAELQAEEDRKRVESWRRHLEEGGAASTNGCGGPTFLTTIDSGHASPPRPFSPLPQPIQDPRDAPSPPPPEEMSSFDSNEAPPRRPISMKRSDTDGTNWTEKEDVRGVRALPGEWEDPVRGDRLEFLHWCRELIEARQGFPFPEKIDGRRDSVGAGGREMRLTPMRLTLDPVKVMTRPLASYLVTNGVTKLTLWQACRDGFRLEREGRMRYLIKEPPGWTRAKAETDSRYRPILFLHGLGIGLGQYAPLVRVLSRHALSRTHPVVIPLWPSVSQNIFAGRDFIKPLSHHETTGLLRRVFFAKGWHRCGVTVLSHSNGTAIHSWLLKSLGSYIRRSCLVDPVVFQLWVPHVVYNFLYRPSSKPIDVLMRYFVGTELGTANYLSRHFDWSSCLLWPQDEIPNLLDPHWTRIYLAQHDAILSADDNVRYLQSFGMRLARDDDDDDGAAGREGTTGAAATAAAPPHAKASRGNLYYVAGKSHGEVLIADGPHLHSILAWLDEPDP